jgi:hypothetical protein
MSIYTTRADWAYHGYDVYIQGAPRELINHIFIREKDRAKDYKNLRLVKLGHEAAVINEENIDYILTGLDLSENPNSILQMAFVSRDDENQYDNMMIVKGDKVVICNTVFSLHIEKEDLRHILNRAKREIKKIREKVEKQKVMENE